MDNKKMEIGFFSYDFILTLPKCFGVYRIFNTDSNKCYVGSTKNLRKRLLEHFNGILKQSSKHIKLLRAINNHKLETFKVEILFSSTVCNKNELLKVEQEYIDFYNSVSNGYNILPTAGSALGYKMSKELRNSLQNTKYWIVVYPDGKKETILNLSEFCKIQGLHERAFRSVAFGKSTSYMGYQCYDPNTIEEIQNKNNKKHHHKHRYEITTPNNTVIIVNSLRKYCLDNGLEYKFLHKLTKQNSAPKLSGRGSGGRHQGYSCKFVD